MSTLWVKEFTGGLDTRRMPVSASGATLMQATNGHITRGGEFEKREAFSVFADIPAGTVGLAATADSLYVFGTEPAPPSMPSGVEYQRLFGATPSVSALARVISVDLYAGKLYVVGEFENGTVAHFYDGQEITDWFDGRARGRFSILSGVPITTPATSASAYIRLLSGSAGDAISDVSIGGSPLILDSVLFSDPTQTAVDLTQAINTGPSASMWQATVFGASVTLTSAIAGAANNNLPLTVTRDAGIALDVLPFTTGGADAVVSSVSSVAVGGVQLLSSPVEWSGSAESTAAGIANAITASVTNPDYTATAVNNTVNILAPEAGSGANGRSIAVTANGINISLDTSTLAGGSDSEAFQPGGFVKTIGQKMFSVSGGLVHFSGLGEPTKWTTDNIGAGFIDLSMQASGAERLVSLERYQNLVAVFAERLIQVWFFDPDPTFDKISQVLNNTGTASPNSVTQFGDNDIFYLDESGLRSLRARDASNAAATTDIGVPIDTLITERLRELTIAERQQVKGLIEPGSGRFWLIMRDIVFVFSYFAGSKVSAWTTYELTGSDGVAFSVDNAVTFNRQVYLRSNDRVFVYGGTTTPVYDATIATARAPYLDANSPTREKQWTALDAALTGVWEVALAMNPNDEEVFDSVAVLGDTTYPIGRIPVMGASTHISPIFKTQGPGQAKIAAFVLHFKGESDED